MTFEELQAWEKAFEILQLSLKLASQKDSQIAWHLHSALAHQIAARKLLHPQKIPPQSVTSS